MSFPCWCPELKDYTEPHIESFERLWSNQSPATTVVDIPTAVKERLISVARTLNYTPDPEIERAIAASVREKMSATTSTTSSKPREPKTINGKPFKMHAHQIEALKAWKAKGDFHGTFELATGAGKTITAIHAVVKLSEKIDRLACVIAVPYQNLADQWIDTLSVFNIYPIRCYVSREQWCDKLRNVVHEFVMGSRKFVAIVVVNRTLKKPRIPGVPEATAGESIPLDWRRMPPSHIYGIRRLLTRTGEIPHWPVGDTRALPRRGAK